jgi:hypothetical protein
MPIPMPTVISKGHIAIRLERRYSTPEKRARSLMYLRDAYESLTTGGSVYGTLVGLPPGAVGPAVAQHLSKALSPDLATLLTTRWFGPPKTTPFQTGVKPEDYWTNPKNPENFWWALTFNPTSPADPLGASTFTSVLSQAAVDTGQRVVIKGLIRALEVSLGLGLDPLDDLGAPPLNPIHVLGAQGEEEPGRGARPPTRLIADVSSLKRNLPIEVFWVCGKFDGFEVQISWGASHVSVHIVTPPVRMGVAPLTPTLPADLDKAMKHRGRAMIVVNAGNIPGGDILPIHDGGLTP